MGTTSLDLRQRILDCYDSEETTQAQVATRFCVSLGLIKKLVAQRRHTGSIAPRHHLAGRRPKIVGAHKRQLRTLLAAKSDLTLREMRAALQVDCTLPAIHYVLLKMGLSYKKKRSAPANKTAPILPKRGGRGAGAKAASTRPSSSSSTSRAPRPT